MVNYKSVKNAAKVHSDLILAVKDSYVLPTTL